MIVRSLFFMLLAAEVAYTYQSSRYSDCPLPRISNGRIRLRARSRLARFQCNSQYELVGNKFATCKYGHWDEPAPICVRPSESCVTPTLEHGVVLPQRRGAWVSFFCIPGFDLRGSSSIYCDGESWNGTAPTCVSTTEVHAPSCDFEPSDICGWRQDELHDFDWRRINRKTPSSFLNTGPKFDHTYGPGKDGYYMYIESTGQAVNSSARLLSPVYDVALAKNGCFQFYYHMFGLSTGGLRVYQKPDSKPQDEVFGEESRSKYVLFEVWRNQGDFWHRGVVPLKDFKEDFQLVIEGIRGLSFTSDIAIDDVSILQGDNCTKALQAVSVATSTVPPVDSCVGRCVGWSYEDPSSFMESCSCNRICLVHSTCCPDYLDVCEFSRINLDVPDDEDLPTEETITKGTSSTVTTTVTTPATTKTKTTKKPTTPTTTTPKPPTTTTKSTTKPITTTSKIPKIIFVTTEKIYNATGDKNTTTSVPSKTTTGKPVTTTMKITTTTTKKLTTETYLNVVDDIVVGTKTETHKFVELKKPSALITTLVIIGTLITLAVVVWLVVMSRSSRGRSVIDRLRGRVYHDPEVRFLTSDDD